MKLASIMAVATVSMSIVASTSADAAFNCGRVQRAYFGLDSRFNLAKNYARLLPHTDAHPGALVVQTRNGRDSAGNPGGHVSRIVQNTGPCRAIVADEKGQYERDICSRLIAYVDANGSPIHQLSARSQRTFRTPSQQYATNWREEVH